MVLVNDNNPDRRYNEPPNSALIYTTKLPLFRSPSGRFSKQNMNVIG